MRENTKTVLLVGSHAIAEKCRPIYEKQARENQLSGLKQNTTVSVNLPKREETIKPVNTSEKLAAIAGVSEKTYYQ